MKGDKIVGQCAAEDHAKSTLVENILFSSSNKNSDNTLINTYGLIETTCIVWIIVLGFFIVLTREVILVVGIIFPILIWALVKKDMYRKNLESLQFKVLFHIKLLEW